ncbi:unnamed protein product [Withania somnifera]
MSRCFPFQPRGYEKKPRPEKGDLLKEDKDRSDGKHREKKEKKDKHRDKKEKHKDKKKDKDKDKDKSSISEEARVAVPPGAASSGEKLHERDERKDRHISSEKGRDEHKDRHINSEKAKLPNQFHGQHGEKPVKTSLSPVEAEDSKFVQELGRRIKDEEKGAQSQLAERSPVEWKRDEKSDRVGIKVFRNLAVMEENKEKGSDNHKMDVQTFRGEHRIGVNAIPPSRSTVAKSSFEGIPQPFKENVGKKSEEKQKPKEKRDGKRREKNKDKEREKQKSEVRPAKLLRPSSSQQPTQNGKKLDTHPKADLFTSIKQGVASDVKVESKEHRVNGSLEGPPLFSVKAKASSMVPGAAQIAEVSKQLLLSVTEKASSVIPGVDQMIAEASKTPAHPDSKYLSQILSVPKMDDRSGLDDQEWLSGSKRTPPKSAEMSPDEVSKEHCVWSEALQIDSADVCALPYVIPY